MSFLRDATIIVMDRGPVLRCGDDKPFGILSTDIRGVQVFRGFSFARRCL